MDKLKVILNALDEKKAEDIVVIDIDKMSSLAEKFVICSGKSIPQIKAIFENLEEKAEKEGYFCSCRDGNADAKWIAADYGDIIVHIFHSETRRIYQLDALWNNGNNVTPYPNGVSLSKSPKAEQPKKVAKTSAKKNVEKTWIVPVSAKEIVENGHVFTSEKVQGKLGVAYVYVCAPVSAFVCRCALVEKGGKTVAAKVEDLQPLTKAQAGFYPRTVSSADEKQLKIFARAFD